MNTLTLKNLIIAQKCRKGPAEGTTKRGAFWSLSGKNWFAKLRRSGGDGIGQSAADVTYWLDFRHFRSGEVRAAVCRDAFHQNGSYSGGGKSWSDASAILDCATAEDVIVTLKGITADDSPIFSDSYAETLTAELAKLGLPVSAPAPDEVPAGQTSAA